MVCAHSFIKHIMKGWNFKYSFIKHIMKGWNFKYYIDYNRFSSFHTWISNTTKTIHYLCYGIVACASTGSWQLEIKEKQIKEQEK